MQAAKGFYNQWDGCFVFLLPPRKKKQIYTHTHTSQKERGNEPD